MPYFIFFFITMFLVVFKKPIFLIKQSFNGLVIHGGSRGTNLLVSLGIKFDMMFKNILVKVLTCQLGSLLILRC